MNMKTILICIVLFFSGCTTENKVIYDSVKLTESYKHQELIKELEKKNVDFYLNKDGSISYNIEQADIVDSITMNILKKYTNGMHVLDSNYEKLITDALAEENIQFKVVVKENDRWIMWDESDHQKVKMVLKDVHNTVQHKEIEIE